MEMFEFFFTFLSTFGTKLHVESCNLSFKDVVYGRGGSTISALGPNSNRVWSWVPSWGGQSVPSWDR